MYRKFPAYLQMAAAMSLAGSSVVVGKLITARLPVFLISGVSLSLSLFCLIPLAWRQIPNIRALSRRNLLIIFLQAIFGTVLFRIFMLFGIHLTSAAAGGLITSSGPGVVAVLALCFLKERLNFKRMLGILSTVAGLLLLNFQTQTYHEDYRYGWFGGLLIFAAVVGEAMFTILQKKLTQKITPLASTALISLFAFLCFLPLAVIDAVKFDFHSLTVVDGLALVYYGIMVTAVAFILWFSGLEKVQASTAAVFTSFMPISSVVLAYLFLKEHLEWVHLASLLLILTGIALMTVVSNGHFRNLYWAVLKPNRID